MNAKDRTLGWLRLLGVSERQLQEIRFIHVAGTKGKGTTCLFCEYILTMHQRSTGGIGKLGCLTSPHLSDVRERIRLNSQIISRDLFARYFWEVFNAMRSHFDRQVPETPPFPGYPGFLTLLGFYVFVQEGVNTGIIETGMGGEKDSTNFITQPVATGINTIGMDHVTVLGNDLRDIAWHKSGIFKSNSPAFTVDQQSSVLDVLLQRAHERHTRLTLVSGEALIKHGITVSPNFAYQRSNAALAIALCDTTLQSIDPRCTVDYGLISKIGETIMPGKNEEIQELGRNWLLDSAHNELSMHEASTWFRMKLKEPSLSKKSVVLIFSHASERDSSALLNILYQGVEVTKWASAIFCGNNSGSDETKPDLMDLRSVHDSQVSTERHAEQWFELTRERAIICDTVKGAIEYVRLHHQEAVVIVAGNLYLAGTVRYYVRPTV